MVKALPKVSILINNFKKTDHLESCLSSLMNTRYQNIELIVMDCCTPNFEEWIITRFPAARFVHLDEDIGAAAQRNIALKHADKLSKYVCFIDDDIVVTPDWLINIVSQMEGDESIGAMQPILFNYDDKQKIDSLGHLMTYTGYPYKIQGTNENLLKLQSKKVMDIFYAETAVVVVRYDVLRAMSSTLEPFDGDYFMHWYDVDLSWRLWLMGYRVVITSESVCYHDRGVSGSLNKLKPENIFKNTRNRLITLLKNYELPFLVKFLPLTLFLEITKTVALICYRPDHSRATIKAIFWVLSHPNYIRQKRQKYRKHFVQTNSKLSSVFIHTNLVHLYRELRRHYE